jgi:hypothetical protein
MSALAAPPTLIRAAGNLNDDEFDSHVFEVSECNVRNASSERA